MKLKKHINSNFLNNVIIILFLVIPFANINHTYVYILFEIIGLYGVLHYKNTIFKDVFIKFYLWFFIWCIIVTLLSVNLPLSLKGLLSLTIPPLLLSALYSQNNWIHKINRCILLSSLINLGLSICFVLTQYFHSVELGQIINEIGGGRIASSSLALYIIIYSLFFNNNFWNKIIVIGMNIVTGLIVFNSNFIFSTIIIMFLYLALVTKKITLIRMVIKLALAIMFLTFILINLLHNDLNISQRIGIYSYWIPKIMYSPYYGVGISLKLQSLFFTTKFPIPHDLFNHDPHIVLHAHNYFIDLILQIGIIGFVLFLILIYKLSKAAHKLNSKVGFSVLFMILAILLKNMVDDQIDGSHGLVCWFFIILTYATTVHLSKSKQNTDNIYA